MMSLENSRIFCNSLKNSHYSFLGDQKKPLRKVRVGFLLLDHFSMANYAAAVDVLVSSNLVHENQAFDYFTIGLNHLNVKSDLGIEIKTTFLISEENEMLQPLDVVIICGGFRSDLSYSKCIVDFIRKHNSRGAYLIGLWNGSAFFAHACLVGNQSIAIHPENQPFIKEKFKTLSVSSDSYVVYENFLSSTGVTSTLQLMIYLLEVLHCKSLAKAVSEILDFNQLPTIKYTPVVNSKRDSVSSKALESILVLMENNIEEPLNLKDFMEYTKLSRRKIERLFKQQLNTSPLRYYTELRIGYARRLLQQTQMTVTEIAIATGFTSASHFSRCYKSYFGVSPIKFRNSL